MKKSVTEKDLDNGWEPPMIATMIGKTFKFLTVCRFAGRKRWQPYVWCRCVCGSDYLAAAHHVKRGRIQSCGCRRKELIGKANTDHGCAPLHGPAKRVYRIWQAMLWRCNPRNQHDRGNYHGRGITVCDRWRGPCGFINFRADMGDPPAGMSIDRIDNDGHYELGNCRWATQRQQASNARSNWKATLKGEPMTIAEATRRLGVGYTCIYHRLYRAGLSKDTVVNLDRLFV